jgi:hypothetical protein
MENEDEESVPATAKNDADSVEDATASEESSAAASTSELVAGAGDGEFR